MLACFETFLLKIQNLVLKILILGNLSSMQLNVCSRLS